jgi:ribosomal protein L12E/L44/L45/RPP1/RPP2
MVLLTCDEPTEERLSQLQELRQKKLAMLRQKMGAQPADATTSSDERTTMDIAPSKPKEEEDNDDEEEEEDEEEEDDDDEDEYDWRAKLL